MHQLGVNQSPTPLAIGTAFAWKMYHTWPCTWPWITQLALPKYGTAKKPLEDQFLQG
jgi:hypothetical protein